MDMLFFILIGVCLTLAGLAVLRRLIGFTAQKPADYADAATRLDLREHLTGSIVCEGVIYGINGRVTSRFKGDFEAEWTGNRGTMTERFEYSTGAVQHRAWDLTLSNDGKISALAEDLVGEGTGELIGDSLCLKYRIRLPKESGGHVLDAVDWMYLTPNGTIVNRSQFRKFGIKVAELVATMRRKDMA